MFGLAALGCGSVDAGDARGDALPPFTDGGQNRPACAMYICVYVLAGRSGPETGANWKMERLRRNPTSQEAF